MIAGFKEFRLNLQATFDLATGIKKAPDLAEIQPRAVSYQSAMILTHRR